MLVRTLNQRHPDRAGEMLSERQTWRALYAAGQSFRAVTRALLPRAPMEPGEDYAARVQSATYAAHAATIIDGLTAGLLEDPPTLRSTQQDTTQLDNLTRNVDGAGHSLAQLASQLFRDIAEQGECWLHADAPRLTVPEGASEGDRRAALEAAGGAYLYRWDPLSVLDYADGRDGQLNWVMRAYTRRERPTPNDAPITVYVWEAIDAYTVRRWEWRSDDDRFPTANDIAIERPPIEHGRGVCPVFRAYTNSALHAMRRMRDPAVRAFRLDAALDWRVYRESTALLAMQTWVEHEDEPPITGTGAYLKLRMEGEGGRPPETAAFIAPPVGLGDIHASRADKAVADIYRVVSAMALAVDPSASKQRASADAQREQWASLDKLMLSYGETVRDVLAAGVDIWSTWWGGKPGDVRVGGLDSYRDVSIDRLLQVATLAQPLLPPAGRRALARGLLDALGREISLSPDERAAAMAEIEGGEVDGAPPTLAGLTFS